MATGLERNKHLNRPRKSEAERRRRNKLHRKRLVALGVPEAKVVTLNTMEMRAMLRRPAKTAKAHTPAKARITTKRVTRQQR